MIKAKLIAKTAPVEDIPAADANEFIAYVARVSNPENQANALTAPRLIKYLAKHRHWSPFEHYYVTMEVEAPKDIAVQLLRHRSFTFQEFSQRYADVMQMGFTERECRLQDEKNRQNSLETDDLALNYWWKEQQNITAGWCADQYVRALGKGIAKEQARAILPIGLTMSRLYVTGNVRSFIHYLSVRQDPTTQKEHRKLADAIEAELNKIFDMTILKPQPEQKTETAPAQKLKPLKWSDDNKTNGVKAKTPLYEYAMEPDGLKIIVKYRKVGGRVKTATGFATTEDAKAWANAHHAEKMAPWLA